MIHLRIKKTIFTFCALLFLCLEVSSQASLPQASFQVSSNAGCAPFGVNFTNTSLNASQYEWDFGNGMNSTMIHPSIVFLNGGKYTIRLIAKDSLGNKDTLIKYHEIIVNDLPTVNFTFNTSSLCATSNQTTFQNLSNGNYSLVWDFGDGHSSTVSSPIHQYKKSGNYIPKLIATDSLGCMNIKQSTQTIHISNGPSTDFIVDTAHSCDSTRTFHFSDLSNTATNWKWDFGDGNNSFVQNPTHQYTNNGQYTVQLISLDTNGCADTSSKTNYIGIHQLSVDHFDTEIHNNCVPFSARFIGDTINSSISHKWDFGNGNTANGSDVTTTYYSSGNYTVKLYVQNSNGCSDTIVKHNHINAQGIVSASFTADSSTFCKNNTVQFLNTSINGAAFHWDFGDSTYSNNQNPTHTYLKRGNYTVKLTATDSMGCSSTSVNSYQVIELNPSFTVSDTIGCLPFTSSFSDSSNQAVKWLWDFGDGDTSHQQNPTHTYITSGNFNVKLKVETAAGCVDSIEYSHLIHVLNDTLHNSMGDTIYGCIPLPVDFSNNKIGSNQWLWDFGDGSTSNSINPTHTFTSPGTYTVSLKTSTANGCPMYYENYTTIIIDSIKPLIHVNQFDCPSATIQLVDTNHKSIAWFWDFGDGTYSTLRNPTHTFPDTGIYDLTLTITTLSGCVQSVFYPNYLDFSNCLVNGIPVPSGGSGSSSDSASTIDSSLLIAQRCAPQFVQFSNPTDSSISWYWDFGDGNTSTLENPLHLYRAPGIFDITLIAQYQNKVDTIKWNDHVKVNGPEAKFGSIVTEGCDSLDIQFVDSSVNTSYWNWQLTGYNPTTIPSPIYKIPYSNKNHSIQLMVKDSIGCSSSAVSILNFPIQNTQFDFPDSVCIMDTVTFVATDTVNFSYIWDFGDGTIDSSNAPIHQYQSPGKYAIRVISSRGGFCIESHILDSIYVSGVNAQFSVSDSIFCKGDSISLVPKNLNGDDYYWQIGNFWTSNIKTPVKQINTAGKHNISLTITKDGCINTYTQKDSVLIKSAESDFSISQMNNCYPIHVSIIDTNSQNNNWEWKLNSSVIHTGSNSSFFTLNDSLADISLKVQSINGCSDSTSKQFIPELLEVNFSTQDTIGCAPFQVSFTNETNNFDHLIWHFGDGDTSSQINPTHTYLQAGNYTVTLIGFSNGNCTDTLAQQNIISVHDIQASFSKSYTVGCTPMLVNFSSQSANAVNWHWDFGDGSTSTAENPIHIYTRAGNFDVSLIATNGFGCSDTVKSISDIHIPGPISLFSISDSTLCGLEQVQFIDSSSNASEWHWSFGDGSSSNLRNPSHIYTSPGRYIATLITKDSSGCVSTYTLPEKIAMEHKPKAEFSIDQLSGCTPFNPQIQNTSSNSSKWLWSMGDGTKLIDSIPNHIYNNSGNYSINLLVENSIGCVDSIKVDSIQVTKTMDATILPVPPICNNDDPVLLSSNESGGIWSANGIIDASIGLFDPSLSDSSFQLIKYEFKGQCPSSDTLLVEVKEAPNANFTSNLLEACHKLKTNLIADSIKTGLKYVWKANNKKIGDKAQIAKVFSPGIYDISLEVSSQNGCNNYEIKEDFIKVYDSTALSTNIKKVSVINSTSIVVEWEANLEYQFDHYLVYRKSSDHGPYVNIASIQDQNQVSYIDRGLDTKRNSYCYKLVAYDQCDQRKDLDQVKPHCSINVSSAKSDTNDITVSWNPYIGCNVEFYEILRKDLQDTTFRKISSIKGDKLNFIDSTAFCNTNYSYKIRAIGNAYLEEGSLSDVCNTTIQGISDYQSSNIISASVINDNEVSIEWQAPKIAPDFVTGYVIHRSINNSDFKALDFVPSKSTSYIDSDALVHEQNYYYKIEVINICPTANTLSNEASSILLQSVQVNDETAKLIWTKYKNWEDGVENYKIQRLNKFNEWETIKIVPDSINQLNINF